MIQSVDSKGEIVVKDKIFSGIQPSGTLTIGNYLGALSNFSKQQEKYDCFYCVVDMHALTAGIDKEDLRKNSLEVLSLYLASGLDPEKSVIFFQSHVPAHAELQWVLNAITPLGQLERMTQFKSKAEVHSDNLYAGLLNYPILMAADIILYDAKYVPVGNDQKQHIELTRDLVEKFNYIYGETFVLPEMLSTSTGSRIMSLQDPTKKMSKSDSDKFGFISMLDDDKTIEKKLKRAVTDSLNNFDYNEEQLGLRNLIEIYTSFSGDSVEDVVNRYKSSGYGKFKKDLIEVVIDGLRPIKDKYDEFISDKGELEKIYRDGAAKANEVADKKLIEVYDKIGFIKK